MTCQDIRQLLLSLDLDEASRQRAAEALAHLTTCDACRLAMRDFDKLTGLLRSDESVADSDCVGSFDTAPFDTAQDHGQSAGQDRPGEYDRATRSTVPGKQNNGPPPGTFSTMSPRGGWKAFEAKLLSAAGGGRRRRARRWWLPGLGALVAVIAVGSAFHLGRRSVVGPGRTVVQDSPSNPVVSGGLSPDDLTQRVRTFGEIDQSFYGPTRWWMRCSNGTAVDTSDRLPDVAATPRRADAPLLLVRLNLRRGAETISQADVVIVPGATARVVVPTSLGPVHYDIVTSASNPMQLGVKLQIVSEPGPQRIASLLTTQPERASLGTDLDLKPFTDASVGRFMLDRQAFDLEVAAATSNLPGL